MHCCKPAPHAPSSRSSVQTGAVAYAAPCVALAEVKATIAAAGTPVVPSGGLVVVATGTAPQEALLSGVVASWWGCPRGLRGVERQVRGDKGGAAH